MDNPLTEREKMYQKINALTDASLTSIWDTLQKQTWGTNDLWNHNQADPITMDEWCNALYHERGKRNLLNWQDIIDEREKSDD